MAKPQEPEETKDSIAPRRGGLTAAEVRAQGNYVDELIPDDQIVTSWDTSRRIAGGPVILVDLPQQMQHKQIKKAKKTKTDSEPETKPEPETKD